MSVTSHSAKLKALSGYDWDLLRTACATAGETLSFPSRPNPLPPLSVSEVQIPFRYILASLVFSRALPNRNIRDIRGCMCQRHSSRSETLGPVRNKPRGSDQV